MKIKFKNFLVACFFFLTNSFAQVSGGLPPVNLELHKKSPTRVQTSPFQSYASFEKYGLAASKMYVNQFHYFSKENCKIFANKYDIDGLFCMYVLHTLAKEHELAFPYVLKAGDLGNPIAQYELSYVFKNGVGVPKNDSAWIYWKKKCAESKYVSCEYGLGWDYMDETSKIPKNYSEAMRLNLLAYEHGHAEGASNVGMLYEKGWGVSIDYGLAAEWYKKAIAGTGSSGQAETRLANLYQLGLGVQRDTNEAKRLNKYVLEGSNFKFDYKKIAQTQLLNN